MAGLKEVRERIKSVKSTQQITKAMKLVSAAKLKKATTAITQMRPYAEKLQEVMNNILATTDMSELSLGLNEVRPVQNVLVVVFTSDRGLCGGFNSNLLKAANRVLKEKYADLPKSNITILPVGKKAFDAFKRSGYDLNDEFYTLFTKLSFEESAKIAQFIVNSFLSKDYDKVEVIYSKFKNAAVQEFKTEEFLPIAKAETFAGASKADYIFEPSKAQLLEELLPKIIKTTFHRFALDNNASEHGARMVAMDSATNNAADLIKRLEIEYNKARQASITNQILEIVGGAAALEA
ncbi:MAG: ATP synthase F1 subunit gamma [Chitinophagales bacterium]|nr:ATP synthase F1 subunit gamma [Chitinophagales bacterium]